MPKAKVQKEIKLPSIPSLYSLLPNSIPYNPYLSIRTNLVTTATTESKKTLSVLEWWFERSEGLNEGSSGSVGNLREKDDLNQVMGEGVDELEERKEVKVREMIKGDGTRGVIELVLIKEREEEEKERRLNQRRQSASAKRLSSKDKKVNSLKLVDKGKGKEKARDQMQVESDDSLGHESAEESSNSSETRSKPSSNQTSNSRKRKAKAKAKGKGKEDVPIPKRGRRYRLNLGERSLPSFDVPEVELPEGLPSSDLLHAIHQYTSNHYSSTYSLLNPLTSLHPYPSTSESNHFEKLIQEFQTQEEETSITSYPTLEDWNSYKSTTWTPESEKSKGIGLNKQVWTNAERAFDSSCLIAIGFLLDLVIKDFKRVERINKNRVEEKKREKVRLESVGVFSEIGSNFGGEGEGEEEENGMEIDESSSEEGSDLESSQSQPQAHLPESKSTLAKRIKKAQKYKRSLEITQLKNDAKKLRLKLKAKRITKRRKEGIPEEQIEKEEKEEEEKAEKEDEESGLIRRKKKSFGKSKEFIEDSDED